MLSDGCLHCWGQRPPAVASERTSVQGCRKRVDWLHTGEEEALQLETPRMSACKTATAVNNWRVTWRYMI